MLGSARGRWCNSTGLLTRGLLGTKPEIPVDAVFAFITVNQT